MKTINLKNITIKEIVLSKIENEYTLNVAYALLDDEGKEWNTKRTTIKNFTSIQSDKMEKVFQLIITKLKVTEQLT